MIWESAFEVEKMKQKKQVKRVALIGANGQLGSDLVKAFKARDKFALAPLTRDRLDIRHFALAKPVLDRIGPDIIVNTAAYHNVDELEDNVWMGFEVNATSVKRLAEYCKSRKAKLVFISTDYVFGMKRLRAGVYTEEDVVAPINAYGVTKVAGEMFIQYINPKYLIIRTSGLFGAAGPSGKGMNFVELMLKLAKEKKKIRVVDDQELSPTYTLDLAEQIVHLLEQGKGGIFHATSEGSCTWYQFAKKIFELVGNKKIKVIPVKSSKFPTRAERPVYSVLSNEGLDSLGMNKMRPWEEALEAYLKEKKYI